ncbi:MAG: Na+/H+ antiporter NhaA, partial [Actinomycetota bacterium]
MVRFLAQETASGVLLVVATAAALLWVNSPWGASYEHFWETSLAINIGDAHLIDLTLHGWVNDALMAIFFFVVGLEIKSELVNGELRELRVVALPAVAALGGMIVPALFYVALNLGGELRGWGVPMATDIAFAVGVLALLGPRVPQRLKLFLLTLAIVDDIGA